MKLINGRLLFLLTALVFAGAALATPYKKVAAQDPTDEVQIGVTYKCEETAGFKILSCDENDRCEVFYINRAAPGGGNAAKHYKDEMLAVIKHDRCKPATGAKPATAEPRPTPEGEAEQEPEPEEKPAPKKPEPKRTPKPVAKPTPEPTPEPKPSNEQQKEDDAASAEPAPPPAGPQFSIGD